MKEPSLDEYCKKIFAFLAMSTVPLRFTRLYKELNARGFKISRPTLIAHLNHLQKHEVVIRKIEGKQNTSYSVNWSKLDYLKFYPTYGKIVRSIRTGRKAFDSLTIDQKVTYVTLIQSLLEVIRLKFEILSFLEPKRRYEANITYLFAESTFESFKMRLLQSCLKSKEDAQETLTNVEELEQRIKDELLGK